MKNTNNVLCLTNSKGNDTMNVITKTTMALVIAATITACGGGGSSTPSTTVTESAPVTTPTPDVTTPVVVEAPLPVATFTETGTVIDGYLTGATVFMDLNYNGIMDSDEPSAITGELGAYNLELTEAQQECAQYVPRVTLVPVGAIDSDDPTTPVASAYELTRPPQFAVDASSLTDIDNITPLTSIIWNDIATGLADAGVDNIDAAKLYNNPSACTNLINDPTLQAFVVSQVKANEVKFGNTTNISITGLYEDYIASGNPESHDIAKQLVARFQARLRFENELRAANPDAVRVNVFFIEGTSNWRIIKRVKTPTVLNSETINVDNVTWTTMGLPLYKTSESTILIGNILYKTIKNARYRINTNNYSCTITANTSTVDDVRISSITNWDNGMGETADNCVAKDIAIAPNDLISHKVRVLSIGNGVSQIYAARLPMDISPVELLNVDASQITYDDLQTLSYIDHTYESNDSYGHGNWTRTRSDITVDGLQVVRESKSSRLDQIKVTRIDLSGFFLFK